MLGQLALLASRVRDPRSPGAWLIMIGVSAVGLISYKRAPSEHDEVEFGYGVAPAWRGRGIGQRAVAQLIALAREDGRITALTACTEAANTASQRVLQRNGFRQVEREGTVLTWRRLL